MNLDTDKYLSALRQTNNPRVTPSTATVTPCNRGWKLVLFHELTPEENEGGHNVYIDCLDAFGRRFLPTANRVRFGWENMQPGELPPPSPFEKAAPEPGANIPVFPGQNLWVEILDITGSQSDRVSGINTAPTGHKSVYLAFQLGSEQRPDGGTVTVSLAKLRELQKRAQEIADALAALG